MDFKQNSNEWIRLAKTDIETAHHLYEGYSKKPFEIICFLSQQAAEKMLKYFLVTQKKDVPKIHDLQDLCERCEEINERFSQLRSSVVIVNRYSVIPRYPNELQIEELDVEKALEHADIVVEFVEKIIEERAVPI